MYSNSEAATAAAAAVDDEESSQTCSTQDVNELRSSSEAPIASVSRSTSIMVTDEVRELTIAS